MSYAVLWSYTLMRIDLTYSQKVSLSFFTSRPFHHHNFICESLHTSYTIPTSVTKQIEDDKPLIENPVPYLQIEYTIHSYI